jgi:hypothetical protein
MSEFRVINKRDAVEDETVPAEHDCCSGNCGGCCAGEDKPCEPNDQADGSCCDVGCADCDCGQSDTIAVTPGTLLKHVVSGELVCVLQVRGDAQPGEPNVIIRTKDYQAVAVFAFELMGCC